MDVIQTIIISIFSYCVAFIVDGERYVIPSAKPEETLQLSDKKVGAQLGFLVRIGDSYTGTLIHL